jgi:hypothetical protein
LSIEQVGDLVEAMRKLVVLEGLSPDPFDLSSTRPVGGPGFNFARPVGDHDTPRAPPVEWSRRTQKRQISAGLGPAFSASIIGRILMFR